MYSLVFDLYSLVFNFDSLAYNLYSLVFNLYSRVFNLYSLVFNLYLHGRGAQMAALLNAGSALEGELYHAHQHNKNITSTIQKLEEHMVQTLCTTFYPKTFVNRLSPKGLGLRVRKGRNKNGLGLGFRVREKG